MSMASPLTVITYDWVPDLPRGYVRDLRVRWAAEEAGIAYNVETVPFEPKTEAHRAMQPFAQVPILRDGEISLFESGAILWYLGEKSERLMPADAQGRAKTVQWLVSGLNSIEPFTMAWMIARVFDRDEGQTAVTAGRMAPRLAQLDQFLSTRSFLVDERLTIADILMADILRIVGAGGGLVPCPALKSYLARLTGRPAFTTALRDQMAHWESADRARGKVAVA